MICVPTIKVLRVHDVDSGATALFIAPRQRRLLLDAAAANVPRRNASVQQRRRRRLPLQRMKKLELPSSTGDARDKSRDDECLLR